MIFVARETMPQVYQKSHPDHEILQESTLSFRRAGSHEVWEKDRKTHNFDSRLVFRLDRSVDKKYPKNTKWGTTATPRRLLTVKQKKLHTFNYIMCRDD